MTFFKRYIFPGISLAIAFLSFFIPPQLSAEDGHRLWLRYDKIQNKELRNTYSNALTNIWVAGRSKTIEATKNELNHGLAGLLGKNVSFVNQLSHSSMLIAGTPQSSSFIKNLNIQRELSQLGDEGYLIITKTIERQSCIIIAANTDVGVLYGSFNFLRLLQTHQPVGQLEVSSRPKIQLRILDHWYNLDGTVERGYAGGSIWHWRTLPDYISPRYTDYARANASVGINGTVLNNVNASARILNHGYLEKVAALADIFRPYGIKVYLSARFSALWNWAAFLRPTPSIPMYSNGGIKKPMRYIN